MYETKLHEVRKDEFDNLVADVDKQNSRLKA